MLTASSCSLHYSSQSGAPAAVCRRHTLVPNPQASNLCQIDVAVNPHPSAYKRTHRRQQHLQLRGTVCQATLDDPEFAEHVKTLDEQRPAPPAHREKLQQAIHMIDEINSKDPHKVTVDGEPQSYRLVYSRWVTDWVAKLDPKASDVLLVLARGRSIESWRLSEIKREEYAPNAPGRKQYENDKRKWVAQRLTGVMREAGYDESSISLVDDIMMERDLPDPRDMRVFDLVGRLGRINYRLLEVACMLQTLRDADALVFMEHNFKQMFDRMGADEVLRVVQGELAKISNKAVSLLMSLPWTPVQRRLLSRALPENPRVHVLLRNVESLAAASTHPGDWRFRDFDYD